MFLSFSLGWRQRSDFKPEPQNQLSEPARLVSLLSITQKLPLLSVCEKHAAYRGPGPGPAVLAELRDKSPGLGR